ncbi:hypothetical protein [Runella slithyformis]|uniref:Uncharacterized protein n=1 Tax=Runella slithyformis (strain ATCC 29530 / DSM 19594 / LMG 11500 / NCIMB 11436 / LSU 4) TaxID=761193 RepID=A0A7U4E7C1_RUNSL|nr:hypothetical protein [Runella slithyformis]AEI50229.1 hypothetical protein Runsl_3872 [Runella slithyformis DSM 19594]
MTKAVLRILDFFQGIFTWLGADYAHLRSIVEIKFIMQNRRQVAAFSQYNQGKTQKDANNAFRGLCIMMLFFGLFMGGFIFIVDTPFYALCLPFSYIMVMSMMLLVSDFSTFLLDTTDNFVLLPRPVGSRTVLLARLVHISAYVLLLSFSIAFFTLVFTLYRFGVAAFGISIILVILTAILSVFFTTLLYMLLMRFTTEERLKDIISFFQIGFTMLITVGYQFIGRLFSVFEGDSLSVAVQPWQYALPPFWMSGTVEWVTHHTPGTAPFFLIALVVPFGCLWILNRFLAPTFNKHLAAMGTGDGGGSERLLVQQRTGWFEWLANRVTQSPLEKAVFELTWKITSRDRRYKLRAYPSLGSILPMFFVFGKDLFQPEKWQDLSHSHTYLLVIYMAHVILATFSQQTLFSEDFKAAGVYFTTPTDSPRDVLLGNSKAVILKFYTPFYLFISTFLLFLWGIQILDDLILCYLVSISLHFTETVLASNFKLPFSKSPSEQKEGGQTFLLVVILLLLPLCGLAHWGLTYIPYGVSVACFLAGASLYALYRRYEKITWSQFDL